MVFNCRYQQPMGFLLFSMVFHTKTQRLFAIFNGFQLRIQKNTLVFCYFQWFSIVNTKKHKGFLLLSMVFNCKHQKPVGFLLFSIVFCCKYQNTNRFFCYFQWFSTACSTTKCIIQAWENAFARFPDFRLVYGS